MESTNLLELLKACPFFTNLKESDLQLLIHYGKLNMFSEGKVIYKIGSVLMIAVGIYFVIKGIQY